jgi:creatinine amidohydrolase/Fe(II)-dependent formamide hydrolase-like protein
LQRSQAAGVAADLLRRFLSPLINRDAQIFVGVDTGETSDVDISGMIDTPNDVHAGEIETSTTLAVRPHLVKPYKIAYETVESTTNVFLCIETTSGLRGMAVPRRIYS